MDKEEKIFRIRELLLGSEVFPKYIKEMLLNQVDNLADNQLNLLSQILSEEKEKLGDLRQDYKK
ncbi:hypothetical protein COV89_01075 [Candidatus Shapirobacteria bacterium CG11_big_fil_rev_8_21_14_0_20_40_12]|uniref:Uncharacterized protein n=1 Tax=Candidatus Shapirobacteria bacterium CG11_big_fil_rev_8_21_14_0_20_40_12 TaxID=1974889 RepID=A0A2H0KIX8_9BACT|nr:MAG: hypothetical protein COV89_01075 [Candidatus Shapirobacteria bacterium CG11_big_fil_rev_8_21_14_0_20_40_12]